MTEYKLTRRAKACQSCERPFEDGETILSVIFSLEEGYDRRDLCEGCFEGAGEAYSHWKSRHPPSPSEMQKLDFNLAKDFLERLIREADPAEEGLAYTLALLLSRKRRVKIKGSERRPDGERLTVLVPRADQDVVVTLKVPQLLEADVDALQARLAALFGFAQPTADSGKEAAGERPKNSSAEET